MISPASPGTDETNGSRAALAHEGRALSLAVARSDWFDFHRPLHRRNGETEERRKKR